MRDPFGLFQENISVSYAHVLLEITEAYGIENQTVLPLYTTNFIGPLFYQAFSFLKLRALS